MVKSIINYITEELVNEDLEEGLDKHDDLLGSGMIDSLGMMKLVVFIENEFKVSVPPEDMTIENFMTVDCIDQYLQSKIDGH